MTTPPTNREARALKVLGISLFLYAGLHYLGVWGLRFPDWQRDTTPATLSGLIR